jgi:hypothetical protein
MGSDGDNGYEARQQETERKKMAARSSINRLFGAADEGSVRDEFTSSARLSFDPNSAEGGWTETPAMVDEAGASKAYTEAQQNRQARDGLYDTVRNNAFDSGKRRLDEDKEQAARKLKFELFARGLSGGSEDIDQNALMGRTYNQGVMDLGAKADSAKAQFRGDDENTRLQLLQSIDAGMDQGSALSSAASRMQVAADRAAAEANGTTLSNVFDSAGLLYEDSRAAKGRLAGQQQAFEMFPQKGASDINKRSNAATGQVYNGAGV